MNNSKFIWFVIYLVLGLYFINSAILYYQIPEAINSQLKSVDKWIRLIGGVLIIFGGVNHYLRISSKRRISQKRE